MKDTLEQTVEGRGVLARGMVESATDAISERMADMHAIVDEVHEACGKTDHNIEEVG